MWGHIEHWFSKDQLKIINTLKEEFGLDLYSINNNVVQSISVGYTSWHDPKYKKQNPYASLKMDIRGAVVDPDALVIGIIPPFRLSNTPFIKRFTSSEEAVGWFKKVIKLSLKTIQEFDNLFDK